MDVISSPQPCAVGEDAKIQSESQNGQGFNQSYASTLNGQQSAEIKPHMELCPISFEQGIPIVEFTVDEVKLFTKEEGLQQAVVMKFSYGKPDLQHLRQILPKQLDVKGSCNIGQLEFRHILVRFNLFEDFAQVISRTNGYIRTKEEYFFFRTFSWTMGFNPREETSKAVVWISFPDLPANLFARKSVLSIASAVGKPIAVDKATQDRTRPSTARVKVLIDLLDEHPTKIKIKIVDPISGKVSFFDQRIVLDNVPEFCTHCYHQGHNVNSCRRITLNETEVHTNVANDKCNLSKLKGDAREFLKANMAASRAVYQVVGQSKSAGYAEQSDTVNSNTTDHVKQVFEGQKTTMLAVVQDDVVQIQSITQSAEPGQEEKASRFKQEKSVVEVQAEEKQGSDLPGNNGDGLDKLQGDAREYLNAKRSRQDSKEVQENVEISEVEVAKITQQLTQNAIAVNGPTVEDSQVQNDKNLNDQVRGELEQFDRTVVTSDNATDAASTVLSAENLEGKNIENAQSFQLNTNVSLSKNTVTDKFPVHSTNVEDPTPKCSTEVLAGQQVDSIQSRVLEEVDKSGGEVNCNGQHLIATNEKMPGLTTLAEQILEDQCNLSSHGVMSSGQVLVKISENAGVIEAYDPAVIQPTVLTNPKDNVQLGKHQKDNLKSLETLRLELPIADQISHNLAIENESSEPPKAQLPIVNMAIDNLVNSRDTKDDQQHSMAIVTPPKDAAESQPPAYAYKAHSNQLFEIEEQFVSETDVTSNSKIEYSDQLPPISNNNINVDKGKTMGSNFQSCHSHTKSQNSETKKAGHNSGTKYTPKVPKRNKVVKSNSWNNQRDYDDEETWGDGLASFSWEEEDQEGDQEDSDDSVEQKCQNKNAKKNHRAIVKQSATQRACDDVIIRKPPMRIAK